MKRFGDFLVNTPLALVVAGGALGLLVLAVVPALHDVAWVLSLVGVLLCLAAVVGWARTWSILQRRIDRLASQAATAYDAYAPIVLTQTPQEEDAEADSRAASDILSRFPEDTGIVRRLRIEAEVTEFPTEFTQPLESFLADHSHTRFDEAYAHRAFMDLYRSSRALSEWIAQETETLDGRRVVTPGDRRDGGWKAFSDAKLSGEEASDAFLRHRAEFARTVLVSRLVEAAGPQEGVEGTDGVDDAGRQDD